MTCIHTDIVTYRQTDIVTYNLVSKIFQENAKSWFWKPKMKCTVYCNRKRSAISKLQRKSGIFSYTFHWMVCKDCVFMRVCVSLMCVWMCLYLCVCLWNVLLNSKHANIVQVHKIGSNTIPINIEWKEHPFSKVSKS